MKTYPHWGHARLDGRRVRATEKSAGGAVEGSRRRAAELSVGGLKARTAPLSFLCTK